MRPTFDLSHIFQKSNVKSLKSWFVENPNQGFKNLNRVFAPNIISSLYQRTKASVKTSHGVRNHDQILGNHTRWFLFQKL